MRINIEAVLITANGTHVIGLPQDQAKFDQSLTDMGILTGSPDEYIIEHARSTLTELNPALVYARDIEELNFLALLIDHFIESEMEIFGAVTKGSGDIWSIPQLVNIAYNIDRVQVEQTVHDIEELGRMYAEENDPKSDELILDNTDPDGDIDYEGIGLVLHVSQRGAFTDMGYIGNLRELSSHPYDGRLFPPYCNSGDSYLGILLAKQGEEKGVDIFLPASDNALNRALRRIGANHLSECDIKALWSFPLSLAHETLPGVDFTELNTVVKNLSELPLIQAKNIFDLMVHAGLKTTREFAEFCMSNTPSQAVASHQPFAGINRLLQAENFKTLNNLAPAFVKRDECYCCFTSPYDITRLVELHRVELSDTCVTMTHTIESGGHRPISDVHMDLIINEDDSRVHAIGLNREGMAKSVSVYRDDNSYDQNVEYDLNQFLSSFLDDVTRLRFEQMELEQGNGMGMPDSSL